MWILDSERMRAADRHAIDELGLPSLVLMENAGSETANVIEDVVGGVEGLAVTVLCGRGNNGGDGFVIARKLAAAGADVVAYLFADPEDLSPDAARQWEIVRRLGIPTSTCDAEQWPEMRESLVGADVIVDALLGTGFRGRLDGLLADVVEDVNALPVPVVAVDVPSGLSGASAAVDGPAIVASVTVTFATPKVCHVFAPANGNCGDVVTVDIGIPAESIESTEPELALVQDELVAELIEDCVDREEDTHKGTFGHVVVVGGSLGMSGAPALAGLAALKAGAGRVTVATPEPCVPSVAAHAPELMQLALPADARGAVAQDEAPVDELLEAADVLVIGCGLGTGAGAARLLSRLLEEARVPCVLDADALSLLASGGACPESTEERPLVLTPHPGELARLTSDMEGASELTQADQLARVRVAQAFADDRNAIVVAKGFRSVVLAPGGTASVSSAGGPGLATAGTGDVLAGILASLVAQDLTPWAAAIAAVHLHGRAGDLAESVEGQMSLTATSVLRFLPAAVDSLGEDGEDDEQ